MEAAHHHREVQENTIQPVRTFTPEEVNYPTPTSDILNKLLEILVALNIIPNDKVEQVKLLMRTLSPSPTYAQMVKGNLPEPHQRRFPNQEHHSRTTQRQTSSYRSNSAQSPLQRRQEPIRGWHTKRHCQNQERGCTKFSNSGPMTMHERECPYRPGGKLEQTRTMQASSSHSLQNYFLKQ
jgi:hypothetical protein